MWLIQGISFMNELRQELKLPAKVFNSAATIFHRFRLEQSLDVYHLQEVVSAALYLASKIESCAKKPSHFVSAAFNLTASDAQKLQPDDDFFDAGANRIVELEPKLLEAISFEFQAMHANSLALQIVKLEFGYDYNNPQHKPIFDLVFSVTLDLNFTYSLLKHNIPPLALASVEVVFRLLDKSSLFDSKFPCAAPPASPLPSSTSPPANTPSYDPKTDPEIVHPSNPYARFYTTRKCVMEVLLDLLDLYTLHRSKTLAGPHFSDAQIMAAKIAANRVASAYHVPRHAVWADRPAKWAGQAYLKGLGKAGDGARENGAALKEGGGGASRPSSAGSQTKEAGKVGGVKR